MNVQTVSIDSIKTKKAATAIHCGLSSPQKMPGKAYGLPAAECNVGAKLRLIPGSTCEDCYALKGRYAFDNVTAAQYRRLEALAAPNWVSAMVRSITGEKFFRWHDSGDVQSLQHLERITAVCEATPATKHWLPTREKAIVREYLRKHKKFPANLVVRISAAMVDGKAPIVAGCKTSTVHKHEAPIGKACQAYRTKKNGEVIPLREFRKLTRGHGIDLGYCGNCRACWNPRVANVSYPKH